MTPLSSKKYVPIGLSCKRDKTMAIISIPPVEAPNFIEMPTPTPAITPPNTAFRIISSDKDKTGKSSKNIVTKITDTML